MAAAVGSQAQGARPWNPDYLHTDRERWICIYPAYINSKKTVAQGRQVPLTKAVENPNFGEIRDVCTMAGMLVGVEDKYYCREPDTRDMKCRGRVRVQLKDEDGTPHLDKFPTRKSVLMYLGENIPKLKARQQGGSGGSSQPSSGSTQNTSGKKKGRRK